MRRIQFLFFFLLIYHVESSADSSCKSLFASVLDRQALADSYRAIQAGLPKESVLVNDVMPDPKMMMQSYSQLQSKGNLIMLEGHLFASSYFLSVRDKLALHKNNGSTLQKQPWVEWVSSQQIWIYHESGASQKIKQILPSRIDLYRGLSRTELNLYKKLKLKISRMSDDEAMQEIRNVIPTDRMIFTSPNRRAAHMWAQKLGADGFKKVAVTFDIDLQKLNTLEDIYLGVENYYVEIAFMSDKAKLELIRGFREN